MKENWNTDKELPTPVGLPPVKPAIKVDSGKAERIAELIRQHKEKFVDRDTGVAKIPSRSFTSNATNLPNVKDRLMEKRGRTLNMSSIENNTATKPLQFVKQNVHVPEKIEKINDKLDGMEISHNVGEVTNLVQSPEKLFSKSGNHSEDELKEDMDPVQYGKRLYSDDSNETRDVISSIIGKGGNYYNNVLVSYMDCFSFDEMPLDEAFRKLCSKLFLTGETQAVDRILYQFARRYSDCNKDFVQLYKTIDIVYGILFSLVLLNTDLHIANVGANSHRKMQLKTFLRNTMELVDSMIEKEKQLFQDTFDDSAVMKKWKKDLETHLKDSPILPPDKKDFKPSLVNQLGKKSSSLTSVSSIGSFTGTKSPIGKYNYSPSRLGPDSSPLSNDSKVGYIESCYLEGILIRKHQMEQDQKARNRRWTKYWTCLRLHSEHNIELAFYKIFSKFSDKEFDEAEFCDRPHYSFQVAQTSCQLTPTEMLSIDDVSTVKLPCHPIYASKTQPYKIQTTEPEVMPMIHGFALLDTEYDRRTNIISLHLSNGNIYLLQAPSEKSMHVWISTINYYSGRYSRQPMRGSVSSCDYGWNIISLLEKEKTVSEARKLSLDPIRKEKPKIFTWIAPTTSSRLVSDCSPKEQTELMEKQVEFVNNAIIEHESYYAPMISYYEDFASVQQHVKSNWHRKHEYLRMELRKYQTYVKALHNPPTQY